MGGTVDGPRALTSDEKKEMNDLDISNTAFANPAECPGLFKYGLKLSPLIYARANAMADGSFVDGADVNNATINQLIHKRTDCGFPGIPKFQCVAIRGCCWDETPYDRHLGIPQCYKKISLIPESIFKIVDAPEDLRPTPGDCNSNFFKIPQLYFEREACNYGIDMYKYDGIAEGLTPLDMPSAEDCQLKLGCCWEDDMEVMQKYPWLPRCYKRQRDSQGIEETDPIQIDLNELVARSADFGGVETLVASGDASSDAQCNAVNVLKRQHCFDNSNKFGKVLNKMATAEQCKTAGCCYDEDAFKQNQELGGLLGGSLDLTGPHCFKRENDMLDNTDSAAWTNFDAGTGDFKVPLYKPSELTKTCDDTGAA